MTGAGHTLSGALAGLPVALVAYSSSDSVLAGLVFLVWCVLGSTAPDWMEIPYRATQKNPKGKDIVVTKRVLKHRGITHIFSLWVMAALWGFYYTKSGSSLFFDIELPPLLGVSIFGFAYGGVLHLLGDMPNRQRVPIFTCYDGVSLGLWESGKGERFTCALLLSLSVMFLFYQESLYLWVSKFVA